MKKLFDSIILLRIPFSIYLMPIYWFSLSNLDHIDAYKALYVFAIFHLLVYPASNGYNSYFDKDTSSIGGLENPPKATSSLFVLVAVIDLLAVGCSYLLSPLFAVFVLIYMLVSKAYSYDRIRLKKYPIIGAASVAVFQGGFTYLTFQYGIGTDYEEWLSASNLIMALVSTLFLLGSYPLTQVYQHKEDAAHGDKTLSMLLGVKGTFKFSSVLFLLASILLLWQYYSNNELSHILIYLALGLPAIIVFARWQKQVSDDQANADFKNAMLMNKVSSLSLSAAFIVMILLK